MITSNIRSSVWHHTEDIENNEYWTYRDRLFDSRAEAEDARGRYEMAEQDHFDNVRKGEE